jgi:hypothetical protein
MVTIYPYTSLNKKNYATDIFSNYEVNLQQRTNQDILEIPNIQYISQYIVFFLFLRLENAKNKKDSKNNKNVRN